MLHWVSLPGPSRPAAQGAVVGIPPSGLASAASAPTDGSTSLSTATAAASATPTATVPPSSSSAAATATAAAAATATTATTTTTPPPAPPCQAAIYSAHTAELLVKFIEAVMEGTKAIIDDDSARYAAAMT
jgi:hypothetical protein